MRIILLFLLSSLYFIQVKGDKASTVVEFAKSKVGCGYIWSGEGQKLTQTLLNELAAQYPDHIDKSVVRKWIGKQVYDCSGLVYKAFQQVGISIYHNAQTAWKNTNWAQSGPISNYPRDKVCILYRYNSNQGKMSHTGIYIGGNQFIHAKGSEYGVVKETMPSTWTHYGIPKGLY